MFTNYISQIRSIRLLCICFILFFTLGFSTTRSEQTEPVNSSGGAFNAEFSYPDLQLGSTPKRVEKPAYPPVKWHALGKRGLDEFCLRSGGLWGRPVCGR